MDKALQQLEPVLAALRPYLTPITTQLPAPLHEFGLSQLGPECYSTIVEKLDPATSPECLQLALSKALGVGIVSMSTIIKVPQLLKLIRSGSAEGISFLSYLLETSAYLITVAYNIRQGNPFSTFGEIGLLAVQNVVISALVLEFQGKRAAAATFVAALGAAGYALFNPQVVDMEVLQYAQAATIPLGIASKLPQIISIAKEKSTGQLSAFAVFNYLFGSLARVFTTLSEVNDPIILWGYIGGAILNVVLAVQMLWYWNAGKKADAGKPKKFYNQPNGGSNKPAGTPGKSPKNRGSKRKA